MNWRWYNFTGGNILLTGESASCLGVMFYEL